MSIDFTNEFYSQLPLQRQYLLLVAGSVFKQLSGKNCTVEELSDNQQIVDKWGVLAKTQAVTDDLLISHAKRELFEIGYIREIGSDGYSPKYFEIDIPEVFFEVVRNGEIFSKMSLLDGRWLGTALDNVAMELDAQDEVVEDPQSVTSDDLWEPLKIERSPEELEVDLELLDAELSKIEGDNGYAATNPDERNAIVKPARGVWQAIKDGGMPSKEVVKSTLLTPFRYLTKKFADAAIGIAAKNIVALALKFLSGT